jgi:two-component system chemotaxis response regulator CheB
VQDPSDAAYPEMPTMALGRGKPDFVAPLADMPVLLEKLVREPRGAPSAAPAEIKYEVEVAKGGRGSISNMDHIGQRSALTCPDCQGTLWEITGDETVRYRCHVGHAYTAEVLALALDKRLTFALASALRVLDERIALADKLHREAIRCSRIEVAAHWAQRAREIEKQANVIRDSLRRVDEIAANYEQN